MQICNEGTILLKDRRWRAGQDWISWPAPCQPMDMYKYDGHAGDLFQQLVLVPHLATIFSSPSLLLPPLLKLPWSDSRLSRLGSSLRWLRRVPSLRM